MTTATPKRRGAYDYDTELSKFVGGYRYDKDEKGISRQRYVLATPLPNYEPVTEDAEVFKILNDIACRGHMMRVEWGHTRSADSAPHESGQWAMFFFLGRIANAGGLSGEGYVIAYSHQKPRVGRFAICKHEKVEDPGANHSRGWHPGHCGKCGMDMTVDSGD